MEANAFQNWSNKASKKYGTSPNDYCGYRTCWSCKKFIECLNSGQVCVLGDALSCKRYEREVQLPKEETKVINGVVYHRIIDEEGDG